MSPAKSLWKHAVRTNNARSHRDKRYIATTRREMNECAGSDAVPAQLSADRSARYSTITCRCYHDHTVAPFITGFRLRVPIHSVQKHDSEFLNLAFPAVLIARRFMRPQFHASTVSCVHSFMRPQFHASTVSCVHSFMRPQFHASTVSCVHSFMRPQFHASTVSCVHSFMRPQFHASTVSCVHSFMRPQSLLSRTAPVVTRGKVGERCPAFRQVLHGHFCQQFSGAVCWSKLDCVSGTH